MVLLGADDPALAEMAAMARAVFERIEARPSLVRLDAAIGGAPNVVATDRPATRAGPPATTG